MEKTMETTVDLGIAPKSYEKELHSVEPFIRAMYQDLEKRIEEFEEDMIQTNNKVKLTDFVTVTSIMAIVTIVAFSI